MTIELTPDEHAAVEAATQLPPIEYGRTRSALAKKLKCGVAYLDEARAAMRGNGRPADKQQGAVLAFSDPEAWPHAVDGAELLDELAAWLGGFMDMSREACHAAALWAALTWFADFAALAPLLIVSSPTKRGGKSRLLQRLGVVVRRPFRTSGPGATPAILFRLNAAQRPTFLIDEAEKLRGNEDSRDLINLLNDGWERGAVVARCVGDAHEVRTFDAFGFRALAAIGDLADTLQDRAVVLRLQRAPAGAKIRRAARREWTAEGRTLAQRFARWAADSGPAFEDAEASAPRPEWLDDRAADVWGGLFAVATAAGGHWPDRALGAARVVATGAEADESGSGIALLAFIRALFAHDSVDRLATARIVNALNSDDEAPERPRGRDWAGQYLARVLRSFDVRPKLLREGERVFRGYLAGDLGVAFARYLPPDPPSKSLQPQQCTTGAEKSPFPIRNTGVDVADAKRGEKPTGARVVADVTDQAPLWAGRVE